MINRLHTSKSTQTIFQTINQTTGLQPFALAKISIALSIKSKRKITDEELNTDTDGLELNRQTICGEFDSLLSCLIAYNEEKELNEDTVFPAYFKAHIDRGAKLLLNEYKYDKNFYAHLCNLESGI